MLTAALLWLAYLIIILFIYWIVQSLPNSVYIWQQLGSMCLYICSNINVEFEYMSKISVITIQAIIVQTVVQLLRNTTTIVVQWFSSII